MTEPSAAEEFARHLRELKDRNGRSYDALARRLGISSSALHRYCSGQSVPPKFELVERLGGLCGADRQELLELHRRWALAVDTRPAATETRPDPDPAAADPAIPRKHRPRRRLRPIPTAIGLTAITTVLAVVGWLLAAGSPVHPPFESSTHQNPYADRLLFSPACGAAVYMGEHDGCVREVQRLLARTGTTIAIDGDFGPETLRRTAAFQVMAGLPAIGIVDEPTKIALYAGRTRLTGWTPEHVAERIRQVFEGAGDAAVLIARCGSRLDPYYVTTNTNGSRNWGVFQLSDGLLRLYGGTPRLAFDPEWNIRIAVRTWATHHDFRDWAACAAAADVR